MKPEPGKQTAQPTLYLWSIPIVTWSLLYLVFATSEPRFAPSNPYGYDLVQQTDSASLALQDEAETRVNGSSDGVLIRTWKESDSTEINTDQRSLP